MTTETIIALEEAYQIPTYNKIPLALEKGAGRHVWDADGNRYLDFYGGHCVTVLGHCPPRVVEAVQHQAGQLMFYSNVAYSRIRAQAAKAVAQMMPEGLQHVFFCNSGSEANEAALKLARKWTGKTGIIAMEGSFHGRTLGSLATTWASKYRAPYAEVLPPTHFVPFGDPEAVAKQLKTGDIAAVILEPIQSMAGIQVASTSYFEQLRVLCDQYGAALIFDEVQTGVGRTGTFSISESLRVFPDLSTMAKSLGAGVPVGATFVSDAIAQSVKYGDQGTTFGGGMLAMAAVRATVETLQEDDLMAQAHHIFDHIHSALSTKVAAVRGKGCLIGVELHGRVAPVLAALREARVLAGGAVPPNVMRLMPALNTTDEELEHFCTAMVQALSTVETV